MHTFVLWLLGDLQQPKYIFSHFVCALRGTCESALVAASSPPYKEQRLLFSPRRFKSEFVGSMGTERELTPGVPPPTAQRWA